MPITGNNGAILIATVAQNYFTEWSVNESVGVANTTSFGGSGWEDATPLIKKWTGSAKGSYDHASHSAAIAAFGTIVPVEFHTDATHKWVGSAILNDIVPKATSVGLVELQFNFTGTGALVYS